MQGRESQETVSTALADESTLHRSAALMPNEGSQQVLQRMPEHSWTHAAPPVGQDPRHRPHQADHGRPPPALIRVAQAKQQRRNKDPSRDIPGQRRELLLQVAAVNGFLADTGRDRDQDPEANLQASLRKQKVGRPVSRASMGAKDGRDGDGSDQEKHSDSSIAKKLPGRPPMVSEYGE